MIAGGEGAEKFSYARRISKLESARLLLDWVYGGKNRGGSRLTPKILAQVPERVEFS